MFCKKKKNNFFICLFCPPKTWYWRKENENGKEFCIRTATKLLENRKIQMIPILPHITLLKVKQTLTFTRAQQAVTLCISIVLSVLANIYTFHIFVVFQLNFSSDFLFCAPYTVHPAMHFEEIVISFEKNMEIETNSKWTETHQTFPWDETTFISVTNFHVKKEWIYLLRFW